jgi:hypothetical protein
LALDTYKTEVESNVFPGKDFSPYKMKKSDAEDFAKILAEQLKATEAKGPDVEDPDEPIKVY